MDKLTQVWPNDVTGGLHIAQFARDIQTKSGIEVKYVTAQAWIRNRRIPPIWRRYVIEAAADLGHAITDEDCHAG